MILRAKTGWNLRGAVCVCLAALVCCLTAPGSDAAPGETSSDRLSFSERISLPYGGQVRRETAELTARILVRLAVLRQVETALAGLTAVRFGLDDAPRLMALANMVLPPMVFTFPLLSERAVAEKDGDGTGLIMAQADVFVPLSVLPGEVQAVLARLDELELQAEVLSRIVQLAGDAEMLIRRASARQKYGPSYDSFVGRLILMEPQLRAM